MHRTLLLASSIFLVSFSVFPKPVSLFDKHDEEVVYVLPEPDALPLLPQPERKMFPCVEPDRKAIQQTQQTVTGECGIDVSHYQGFINWKMVAVDPNVKFVYIKATESNTIVDSHYHQNQREARAVGLPVGVYHFFSPTTSAYTQLRNFSDNVNPRKQDLVPIVDVEKRGRGRLGEFQSRLRAFLVQIEKMYGVKPIIYTGVNFYNEHLAGAFLDYKFMIARYNVEVLPTLLDNPQIVLWQFTCKGLVNGIQGNVDRSCFVGNYGLKDIFLPSGK